MPAGADTANTLAEQTIAVYQDAERIMMQRVARRLALGLESPSWAEEKLAEIQSLNRELGLYMSRADKQAEASVRSAIERAYRLGALAAADDLEVATAAAMAATSTYTVGVMVADAMRLYQSTYTQVLRSAVDVYRGIVSQAATQVAAGTLTRREATQAALWKFADSGVTGFVDKSGRNWDLSAYTEMATRTAVGHAAINGHLETLSGLGQDLVIVSNAPGECPRCAPWEGKVLSIKDGGGQYPTVDDATGDGLFHPGCRHNVGAYFPGITPPMGPTEDPAGYAARQKLRYLERQTRAAKLREATAISPHAAAQARARVRTYQAAIRQHVDETGLIRQRHREQINLSTRTNAIPQLPNEAKAEAVLESRLPAWARGGAIEKAQAAFVADGGFLPLTDANGKILDDEKWVRANGLPSERAFAHLAHVKAAGADIEAEIERRTDGYFGRLGAAQAANDEAKQETNALVKRLTTGTVAERDAVARDYNAAMQRWQETSAKLAALRSKYPDNEVRAVLGDMRPMGGDLKLKEIEDGALVEASGKDAERLAKATENYPRQWVEQSNGHNKPLTLVGDRTGRGYYRSDRGQIAITDGDPNATHELGHRMEDSNPALRRSEWVFYTDRVGNEPAQQLSELVPGAGYGEHERTRLDKFPEPYFGKDYGYGPTNSYELATMGMESLMFNRYAIDADYRHWLLGTLGLL